MNQYMKTLVLPLAMLVGFLFSDLFAVLNPVTPYILFAMLLVTFCRISPSELRFSRMMIWLLLVQVVGGVGLYLLLALTGEEVTAQGVAMCVFAPTAIGSVVMGAMLGADIGVMASFTILSNMTVAVISPVLFAFVGNQAGAPFWESFVAVISRVGPLLVLPMAIAFLLKKVAPPIHRYIRNHQIISFYLWSFALIIVTARTVQFILAQDGSSYTTEIVIAAGAFVACIVQFVVGRIIGRRFGEPVSGGQSLGQKNTLLAIWMAQTYFHPLASIGPASYVLWQNVVNSWQLWRRREKKDGFADTYGDRGAD